MVTMEAIKLQAPIWTSFLGHRNWSQDTHKPKASESLSLSLKWCLPAARYFHKNASSHCGSFFLPEFNFEAAIDPKLRRADFWKDYCSAWSQWNISMHLSITIAGGKSFLPCMNLVFTSSSLCPEPPTIQPVSQFFAISASRYLPLIQNT